MTSPINADTDLLCATGPTLPYSAASRTVSPRDSGQACHSSVSELHEVVHLLVGVHRRRRQPDALGAARHGRIVNRLHVDRVAVEQRVRHRFAVHRIADRHRNDVARVGNERQAGIGKAPLERLRALVQPGPLDDARS